MKIQLTLKGIAAGVVFGVWTVSPALAQIPVTDVGAIIQLIQQIQTAEQQLVTLKDQLKSAQSSYQSMTGNRGMERLGAGTNRNYLPANWSALSGASNGSGAVGAEMQSVTAANAVLPQSTVDRLPPTARQSLLDQRRNTALLQVLTREALANSSARFAAVQQLIDAIPGTTDPKAIAELQARIAAEQGMLANENTKLNTLYQAMQAERAAAELRAREQAVADFGSLRSLPPLGLK